MTLFCYDICNTELSYDNIIIIHLFLKIGCITNILKKYSLSHINTKNVYRLVRT